MLLHLLTQDPEGKADSVEVGGVHWRLLTEDLGAGDAPNVEFTCVSYTWGSGRTESPFDKDFEVSDRTKPALIAVMRHRPSCKRIWIDAYCVPTEPEEKARTLKSMGYIYSQAQQVVVVLSSGAHSALQEMSKSARLRDTDLVDLEKEEWVSRAWTYQEAVNSKELYITCEDSHDTIVDGSHFLNCLGYTLSQLGSAGLENEKREKYPRLDAFEDLIADYMIAGYQERSALQVMSNMERRTQHRSEDHFYAMIGAISTACASSSGSKNPCETFMLLCEMKGDYSFIYSAAKRDSAPSRRWRPVAGNLPPIVPWHSWGEGQPGHEDSGHLYLDGMMALETSPVDDDGKKFVEEWLDRSKIHTTETESPLHQSAYIALQRMGFHGSPEYLSTPKGYFFPFEHISTQVVSVLVATRVRWTFGAPGLVCYSEGNMESYMPGVFFGHVDNEATKSVRVS